MPNDLYLDPYMERKKLKPTTASQLSKTINPLEVDPTAMARELNAQRILGGYALSDQSPAQLNASLAANPQATMANTNQMLAQKGLPSSMTLAVPPTTAPGQVVQNGMAASLAARSGDSATPAGQPDDGLLRARFQRLNELYNNGTAQNLRAKQSGGKIQAIDSADLESYRNERDQIGAYINKTGQAKELAARQQISPETRAAKAAALDVQALKNVTTANQTGNGMETDPALIAKLQSRLANPYAPPPDATNYAGRIAGLGANAQADVGLADKTQSDRVTSMKLRDEMKAKAGTLAKSTADAAIAEQDARKYAYNNPVTDIKNKLELAQYEKALSDKTTGDQLATLGFNGTEDFTKLGSDIADAVKLATDASLGNNQEEGMALLQNQHLPRLAELAKFKPELAQNIIRGLRTQLAMAKTGFWNEAGQFLNRNIPDSVQENYPGLLKLGVPGVFINQAKNTRGKNTNAAAIESTLRSIESKK